MTEHLPTPLRDEMDLSVARLVRAVSHGRLALVGRREEELRELAEGFVVELHGAMRMTRVEDLHPRTLATAIRHLEQRLEGLISLLGPVRLQVVERSVFVARRRLRLERHPHVAGGLSSELWRHECGGLVFHEALGSHSIRLLLELLVGSAGVAGRRLAALDEALVEAGVDKVRLLPSLDLDVELDPGDSRESPTVELHRRLEGCLDELVRGREPDFLVLREAVSAVLPELGESSECRSLQVAEASPYVAHLLRVCELALRLGVALDLDGGALQELGCLALLHDADALLGGQEGLHAGRVRWMQILLRRRGFHPGRVRRLLGFLEHDRDFRAAVGTPSVFGRILRVADDYDNLVRSGGGGLSPAHALEVLGAGAGSAYDPVVVQELVNLLGRHPPGTVLELEDGRVVRVVSACRSPATFGRPLCEVVRLAGGGSPASGTMVDLAHEGTVLRVMELC